MAIAVDRRRGGEASLARLALDRGRTALYGGQLRDAVRELDDARREALRSRDEYALHQLLELVRDRVLWWGVNSAHNIYAYTQDDATPWVQIPGGLSDIGAGVDGAVWGVNPAGNIYRYLHS